MRESRKFEAEETNAVVVVTRGGGGGGWGMGKIVPLFSPCIPVSTPNFIATRANKYIGTRVATEWLLRRRRAWIAWEFAEQQSYLSLTLWSPVSGGAGRRSRRASCAGRPAAQPPGRAGASLPGLGRGRPARRHRCGLPSRAGWSTWPWPGEEEEEERDCRSRRRYCQRRRRRCRLDFSLPHPPSSCSRAAASRAATAIVSVARHRPRAFRLPEEINSRERCGGLNQLNCSVELQNGRSFSRREENGEINEEKNYSFFPLICLKTHLS